MSRFKPIPNPPGETKEACRLRFIARYRESIAKHEALIPDLIRDASLGHEHEKDLWTMNALISEEKRFLERLEKEAPFLQG